MKGKRKQPKVKNISSEASSEVWQLQELRAKAQVAKRLGSSYRRKSENKIANGEQKSTSNARISKWRFRFLAWIGIICLLVVLIALWLEQSQIPVTENSQLEAVELVRVVDGDTIIVSRMGEDVRVRLLCVDCPESVHPNAERNSIEGQEASAFTKEYLADYSVLYLQFDEEPYDKYNRLLAYVWLEDDVSLDSKADVEQYMFNAILLEEGYARTVVYEPNHRYAEWFYEIEETNFR